MEKRLVPEFSGLAVREALRLQLEAVSSGCVNCNLCSEECAFLSIHGRPKEIADGYDPDAPPQSAHGFSVQPVRPVHGRVPGRC